MQQPIRLPYIDTEKEGGTKLRDWESEDSEYDSANFRTAQVRHRKSTGEYVRKRFGDVDGPVSEADSSLSKGEVRSVSEQIRRRKRTLTILRGIFPF